MSVYFIRNQEYIKIGYSNRPFERILSLQTASPHRLDVLFVMPGNVVTEKELHSSFSEYHHLNEWYKDEGELHKFIIVGSSAFASYTSLVMSNAQPQNDQDWEYWKNRATKAEQQVSAMLSISQTASSANDWRKLSDVDRSQIARLTPEQIINQYSVSAKTAGRWLQKAGQLQPEMSTNGHANGVHK